MNNTMVLETISGEVIYPDWFGNEDFHKAHRSNLLRKDMQFYSQYGWSEPISMGQFRKGGNVSDESNTEVKSMLNTLEKLEIVSYTITSLITVRL